MTYDHVYGDLEKTFHIAATYYMTLSRTICMIFLNVDMRDVQFSYFNFKFMNCVISEL